MKATALLPLAVLLGLALPAGVQAGSDSFAGATNLTDNNWPPAVSLSTFTVESGEPGHKANNTAGAQKSAWWKWTAPANGFCTVDTLGMFDDQHIYDTLLSVYTGSAVDALTRVASNDDHGTSLSYASSNASSVTFYATAGTTYHMAVDGYNGSSVNANNHKVQLRLRLLHATAEQRIGVFGIPEQDFMHGMIQLSKTAGHAFSGKLLLTGKSYPFSGVFGVDGYASVSIERRTAPGGSPQPPLTLLLDGTRGSEFALVSHLYGGSWQGKLYTRQTFTKGQESSLKGRYAATIGHKSIPGWAGGILSFTTSTKGQIQGAGVLPDGTKITVGSSLCVNDGTSSWVPLYLPLYKNGGYLTVAMKITEDGTVDQVTTQNLDSEHFRPASPGSVFMPNGTVFFYGIDIRGATYTPPAASSRALGFLDGVAGTGQLSLPMVNDELDPAIGETLTFSTGNAFSFASAARKPVLKLNKATGLVTGSLVDNTGLKRNLTGILFLDGMTPKLQGHASGVTRNVFFEVVP